MSTDKARKGGKIPWRPKRDSPDPEWRAWLSDALGLPEFVWIEEITRNGVDDADAITITLSNGIKMRCPHQKRLQSPAGLHSFITSASCGLAQPESLRRDEVADVFVAMCVLGTTPGDDKDPVAELREHLAAFVGLCEPLKGSFDHEQRYDTIARIKARPAFDKSTADMHHEGQPVCPPVLVLDEINDRRYIRAGEWVAYLRYRVGETVDPSALKGRMAEIECERYHPQQWNADRSHKHNVVVYAIPSDL